MKRVGFLAVLCGALLLGPARGDLSPPSSESFRALVAALGAVSREERTKTLNELRSLRDRFPLFVLQQGAEVYGDTVNIEARRNLETLLEPLVKTELYDRPFGFIGINMAMDRVPARWKLEQGMGIVLKGVVEGFPGEKAGMKVGDWILEVDGRDADQLGGLEGFIDYVASLPPGMEIELVIRRDEVREQKLPLVLGQRPGTVRSSGSRWGMSPQEYFEAWLQSLPRAGQGSDPEFPVGHFE